MKHIDADNNVLGSVLRSEIRQRQLWHRCTYIIIENSSDQYLIQRRTLTKDYCPGYFDLTTGGVVGGDEDEDEGAVRELEEEMGIKDVKLEKLPVIKFEPGQVWAYVYRLTNFEGVLTLQESEVAGVEKWTKEEILAKIESGEKITPDSIHVFRELLKQNLI